MENCVKKLQVEPSECMYVGDTNTDMKTGKAAGMYTIECCGDFGSEKNWKRIMRMKLSTDRKKLLKIQEEK